jgi:hypothetical protein
MSLGIHSFQGNNSSIRIIDILLTRQLGLNRLYTYSSSILHKRLGRAVGTASRPSQAVGAERPERVAGAPEATGVIELSRRLHLWLAKCNHRRFALKWYLLCCSICLRDAGVTFVTPLLIIQFVT